MKVFVSIASYRDPELAPTLRDLFARADHPERLRVVVCDQHGPEAFPEDLAPHAQIERIAIPWQESRGACWARALIQDRFADEAYYLQLDSHHRFAAGWDTLLLDQLALTGRPRALLTAYVPAYRPAGPDRPEEREAGPLALQLDGFHDDGIAVFRPEPFQGDRPICARFVSGHFLFAPGAFVREVPYDRELYFIGEEISLSVRAFLAGWYLYHPCVDVVWHEYTRDYRPNKHWTDHQGDAVETPWWQRDRASKARVTALLRGEATPAGSARTLAAYEAYAGLSFRRHRAHPHTLAGRPPPTPVTPGWETAGARYRFDVPVPDALLAERPETWVLTVYDADDAVLHRREHDGAAVTTLPVTFDSATPPARWWLCGFAHKEARSQAQGEVSVLPEPPQATYVTALVDLGRDALPSAHRRDFAEYRARLDELLSTSLRLVVFVEADDHATGALIGDRAEVRTLDRARLRGPHHAQIQRLRQDEAWCAQAPWLAHSPQASLEDYAPLVFAKLALLDEVAAAHAPDTRLFWIDAGLTRTVQPAAIPHLGREVPEGQLRLFAWPYPVDTPEVHGFAREGMTRFAGKEVEHVVRGGFFGGAPDVIHAAAEAFAALLRETLDAGYLGTEESIFAILHARGQAPFHAVTPIGSDGLIPSAPGGRLVWRSSLPSAPDRVALLAEARQVAALPRTNGPAALWVRDFATATLLAPFAHPGDAIQVEGLPEAPTSAFVTAADRARGLQTLAPAPFGYVKVGPHRAPPAGSGVATSAVYLLSFNAPDQLGLWLANALAEQPELLAADDKVLINNSTDRATDAAYDALCCAFGLRQLRFDNVGITGGRLAATADFLDHGLDHQWYFEDDMLFATAGPPLCRNGFVRIVPRLFPRVTAILANEPDLDAIKLSYTEHFGCHQLDWAFVNATPDARRTGFSQGSATVIRAIRSHDGLPYALGDVHYSHWPTVLTRRGAHRLFGGDDLPADETGFMARAHALQREGGLSTAVLLASPIEHERSSGYEGALRKES